MNKQERQEAARNGYHFLRNYIESQIVDERLRAEIGCLLDEFKRLDEKERNQAAQGEHGSKAPAPGKKRGRPKKNGGIK